jgi:uncharacterized protein
MDLRLPLLLLLALAVSGAAQASPGPIIDMHVHAYPLEVPPGTPACPGDQPVPVAPVDPREELDLSTMGACAHPMLAPSDDDGLMRDTLAALRKHDVRHAMTEARPNGWRSGAHWRRTWCCRAWASPRAAATCPLPNCADCTPPANCR